MAHPGARPRSAEARHAVAADVRGIVLFDGDCSLCASSVAWIRRRDKAGRFRFVANRSEEGSRLVDERGLRATSEGTLVYLEDGDARLRSSAVVRILRRLGGVWRLVGALLWLVPKPLRDLGYRIVARNRHRLRRRSKSEGREEG